MKADQLTTMSESDLESLANDNGLQIDPSWNKQALISALQEHMKSPKSQEKADKLTNAKPAAPNVPTAKPRYRIIIHRQDSTDGMEPVAIGINEHVIRIPRDMEVSIPEDYLEVLKSAVYDVPKKTERGLVMESVRRYPFTVLGPAGQAAA